MPNIRAEIKAETAQIARDLDAAYRQKDFQRAAILARLHRLAVFVMEASGDLTFKRFREANVARCVRWHTKGLRSWSAADWMTAITGELGELASLIKMRNRERDAMPGNKFSPTDEQIADEIADVFTYLDLLAATMSIDLGAAVAKKFNEVSARVGFPERIEL